MIQIIISMFKKIILLILISYICIGVLYAADIESKFGSLNEVDGKPHDLAWSYAEAFKLNINLPFSKKSYAVLKVLNDSNNIYFLFKFKTPKDIVGQSFFIRFNDKNGKFIYDGQDVIAMNPVHKPNYLIDSVRTSQPPCSMPDGKYYEGKCGFEDTKVGGTRDGLGTYSTDNNYSYYEFSHPLASKDKDVQLRPGQIFGIILDLRLIDKSGEYPESYGDTDFPESGYLSVKLAAN